MKSIIIHNYSNGEYRPALRLFYRSNDVQTIEATGDSQ